MSDDEILEHIVVSTRVPVPMQTPGEVNASCMLHRRMRRRHFSGQYTDRSVAGTSASGRRPSHRACSYLSSPFHKPRPTTPKLHYPSLVGRICPVRPLLRTRARHPSRNTPPTRRSRSRTAVATPSIPTRPHLHRALRWSSARRRHGLSMRNSTRSPYLHRHSKGGSRGLRCNPRSRTSY